MKKFFYPLLLENEMANRVFSPYTSEALTLFGKMIQVSRKEKGFTLKELAERAGVSRSMVQRIEKCEPGTEIGVVFEVAHLLGISLFNSPVTHRNLISQLEEKLALLPGSVRKSTKEVSDDF